MQATGDGQDLYFTSAASLAGGLEVFRSRFDAGLGAPDVVGPIDGVVRLQSFPRFVALGGGGVGVAFHDGAGRPSYAWSPDGLSFSGPVVLDDAPRALAHVASFANDALAFTYQTGQVPQIQVVHISPSPEGTAWSEPMVVTDSSQNVHDASALPRLDGALDLYYIFPVEAFGFSIWRRSLSAEGALGDEERITFGDAGDATKPNPVRLGSGGIGVVYAEITARGGTGEPIAQRLGLQVLEHDAP